MNEMLKYYLEQVFMGQIKKADSSTSQFISELSEGFGIGIYNHETNESYLLNYIGFGMDTLKKDLENIVNDFGNKSYLKVIVSGKSLNDEEGFSYNSEIIIDRVGIRNILDKFFYSENILEAWNGSHETSSLYINKQKQNFEMYKMKSLFLTPKKEDL